MKLLAEGPSMAAIQPTSINGRATPSRCILCSKRLSSLSPTGLGCVIRCSVTRRRRRRSRGCCRFGVPTLSLCCSPWTCGWLRLMLKPQLHIDPHFLSVLPVRRDFQRRAVSFPPERSPLSVAPAVIFEHSSIASAQVDVYATVTSARIITFFKSCNSFLVPAPSTSDLSLLIC
ncbi:hypothetical protein BKA70DRAFT_58321 [Coprinopsis sp. MPI-PUGE-AT-0042]|nr:hypothetical protein BKA70DRAFT_58321 [Coprinopsis sp. MPI-PUGE-AT-0042]